MPEQETRTGVSPGGEDGCEPLCRAGCLAVQSTPRVLAGSQSRGTLLRGGGVLTGHWRRNRALLVNKGVLGSRMACVKAQRPDFRVGA